MSTTKNEPRREFDPATLSNRDVVTQLELDGEDGNEGAEVSGETSTGSTKANKKGSKESD